MKTRALVVLASLAAAATAWVSRAPLPEPRYSGAAVTMGRKLYHIGGSVAGGVKTRSLYIYDSEQDSWSIGDSMTTARHRFGAAMLDGKIYVYGGWGDGGALLKSGECYDPSARTWTPIETLPGGRASVFSGAANGKVYCIGGWTGTIALNQTLEYDPSSGHWQEKAPMPTPRGEGMSASDGNWVYCFGGTPDGAVLLDTLEVFVAADNQWFAWQAMPTARMAGAAVTDARDAWVLGGIGEANRTLAVNEGVNVPGGWRACDALPVGIRFLTACYLPADSLNTYGYVFAIGGQDSLMQPLASVYRWLAPLGIQDLSGQDFRPAARASFVRSGAALTSPVGTGTGILIAADGRSIARVRHGSSLPLVARGLYFTLWRTADGRNSISRLVVLSR